jgi:hypothetical protein
MACFQALASRAEFAVSKLRIPLLNFLQDFPSHECGLLSIGRGRPVWFPVRVKRVELPVPSDPGAL